MQGPEHRDDGDHCNLVHMLSSVAFIYIVWNHFAKKANTACIDLYHDEWPT